MTRKSLSCGRTCVHRLTWSDMSHITGVLHENLEQQMNLQNSTVISIFVVCSSHGTTHVRTLVSQTKE